MEVRLKKGPYTTEQMIIEIIESSPRKAQVMQAMQNVLALPPYRAAGMMRAILTDLVERSVASGRCTCGGFLNHTGNPNEFEYTCSCCGRVWTTTRPIEGAIK